LVFGRYEGLHVTIFQLRCTVTDCNRIEEFLWACRWLLVDRSVDQLANSMMVDEWSANRKLDM